MTLFTSRSCKKTVEVRKSTIEQLTIRLPLTGTVRNVRSVESGPLTFATEVAPPVLKKMGFAAVATFTTKLGLNDIICLRI